MNKILLPASEVSSQTVRCLIPLLLIISALLIFTAPLAMPDNYSFVANVISESAAQGVEGAWIARLGFILFGLAVMWQSMALRRQWAAGAYWCHLAFAIFMISTAAFSHKPWLEHIPYDEVEDLLHSFTATAMGFAFSFGVLFRLLQRKTDERNRRLFDIFALLVATVIPLLAWYVPTIGGLVQRALFAIAYIWYGSEALKKAK
jgi:hypothetical protein